MTFARKLIISAVLAGCVFAAAHVARRLGVLEGGAAAEELLWGAGQHTMPAAVLHGHGPPEAFELELIPKPTVLGSHEVLVRVKAASVNPIDAKLRSGNLAAVMTVEFPAVLGIDFAGVVERVGSRVASSSAVRPGDRVFGRQTDPSRGGSYAGYVRVPVEDVWLTPDGVSHDTAAAAPTVGLTAWEALVAHANLVAGDSVLVVGATGGVGSYAVQLAHHLGAHVTAYCSGRNAELAKTLGADVVVDRHQTSVDDVIAAGARGPRRRAGAQSKLVAAGRPFDVVLDCVGGDDIFAAAVDHLPASTRFVTIVGPMRHAGAEPIGVWDIMSSVVLFVGRWIGSRVAAHVDYSVVASLHSENLRHVAELMRPARETAGGTDDDSVVTPLVAQISPLSAVTEAHELMESHGAVGKFVLTIHDEDAPMLRFHSHSGSSPTGGKTTRETDTADEDREIEL